MRFEHQLAVVATEAKRVTRLAEWIVKIGGVLIPQQATVTATMNLVAFDATSLRDGSVEALACLNERLHVDERSAIWEFDGLIVALEADVLR